MNKEGYADHTAETAIGRASKKPGKPIKPKCEEQFGYVLKKLREIERNQREILRFLKNKD